MRARSASSSASGVIGTVNGRITAAPAEFSVVLDMWVSRLVRFGGRAERAVLDEAGALLAGQAGGRSAPRYDEPPHGNPRWIVPGRPNPALFLERTRGTQIQHRATQHPAPYTPPQ